MADNHYADGLKFFTAVGKGRQTLPRIIKEGVKKLDQGALGQGGVKNTKVKILKKLKKIPDHVTALISEQFSES